MAGIVYMALEIDGTEPSGVSERYIYERIEGEVGCLVPPLRVQRGDKLRRNIVSKGCGARPAIIWQIGEAIMQAGCAQPCTVRAR